MSHYIFIADPLFVLAFLRSLVDEGLLEFSLERRRWTWDENQIRSADVADNVLYLLSSDMSGLPDDVQLALKVAACFGTKIDDSVVRYLSATSEHSDIRDGLNRAVEEGFMIKVGASGFKFVHDKVREGAYSLIQDNKQVSVIFTTSQYDGQPNHLTSWYCLSISVSPQAWNVTVLDNQGKGC